MNRKKATRVELKVSTLNVGTMTGKSRELADVMERRKVDAFVCPGNSVERREGPMYRWGMQAVVQRQQ